MRDLHEIFTGLWIRNSDQAGPTCIWNFLSNQKVQLRKSFGGSSGYGSCSFTCWQNFTFWSPKHCKIHNWHQNFFFFWFRIGVPQGIIYKHLVNYSPHLRNLKRSNVFPPLKFQPTENVSNSSVFVAETTKHIAITVKQNCHWWENLNAQLTTGKVFVVLFLSNIHQNWKLSPVPYGRLSLRPINVTLCAKLIALRWSAQLGSLQFQPKWLHSGLNLLVTNRGQHLRTSRTNFLHGKHPNQEKEAKSLVWVQRQQFFWLLVLVGEGILKTIEVSIQALLPDCLELQRDWSTSARNTKSNKVFLCCWLKQHRVAAECGTSQNYTWSSASCVYLLLKVNTQWGSPCSVAPGAITSQTPYRSPAKWSGKIHTYEICTPLALG